MINEAGYTTFHSGKPDNACRYANAQFQTNIESGKNRNSAVEHAENVLKFLADHDGAKPFFIFLAPPVPHDPCWASKPFVDLYDPAKLTLSKNLCRSTRSTTVSCRSATRSWQAFRELKKRCAKHLADYYASVSELDQKSDESSKRFTIATGTTIRSSFFPATRGWPSVDGTA